MLASRYVRFQVEKGICEAEDQVTTGSMGEKYKLKYLPGIRRS